ncbi:MAG: nucleoside hydrolase [Acidimicrobiia bacterium]|jgi:inosine-uridine nucleoside N-ribohydrolase|nr:MAG: nucleoside hydrolase [Acidimicrobiia bacterium]
MPRPVLIDTDPGVDDVLAIAMLLASPEVEVIGLTTVHGNMSVDVCTRNALYFLEVASRTDIPVARGAGDPIAMPFRGGAAFVHGPDGLGDRMVDGVSTTPVGEDAADFIIRSVRARPGEVVLAPIGPLTNLAVALERDPGIAELTAEVVVMGGNAYCDGNASPAAEANILNDPEAAEIVFGADWPVVMLGLDVTDEVSLTGAHLDRIAAGTTPMHALLREASAFYQRFHEEAIPGYDGLCPHDATALAWLIDPSLFEVIERPIRVGMEGLGRGKTWPAEPYRMPEYEPWRGRPEVTIATQVDASAMADLITTRLVAFGS